MAGYSTPAWTNGSSPAINAAALTAMGQAIELSEHPYGTCTTASATAAKTVTIDFSGTLSLFTGLSVRVKFNNANTAASPTLNVNGTGAKSIVSPGYTGTITWSANQVIDFTYNGSQWVFFSPDTYTKTQSLSSATASAMNSKFGSTPSTPDAALALLTSVMPDQSTNAKIKVGSYTGTGTYGVSNPTTINVGFLPKFMLLSESQPSTSFRIGSAYSWLYGYAQISIRDRYSAASTDLTVSTTSTTISWYYGGTVPSGGSGAMYQNNQSGTKYSYIILG